MKEDKLNDLKRKALAAAHDYWEAYAARHGEQDNMLTWVRDETTGEMLCLTKGGYTDQLANFISKLS